MTTKADAPTLSLHRKLAEVMAEVERIPKRGRAPAAMGGFEFVQVGDAADAIRRGLSSRGVSMLPSAVEVVSENEHATARGGTMTTQSIRTTWTLTDGDSGEQATIQSLGTGADTGDKFSPKAQTNSMKYALLMGFLLSTGDDPELSDSSDRQARRNGQAAPEASQEPAEPAFRPVAATHEGGLIGIAEKGKADADFEAHITPTGHRLAFRLTEGRRGVKVVAVGIMAELIETYKAGIENQRVTLWGTLEDDSFEKLVDGKVKSIPFQYVALERLKVGALDLSAPNADEPGTAPTAEEEEEMAQLAFGEPRVSDPVMA